MFKGIRLKYLRNKKGLTQRQVADALEMNFLKYARMEIFTNPLPDDLVRICLFFRVSADWILGFNPPNNLIPKNIEDDEPGFKGDRLKYIRELKGLNQNQAAEFIGMPWQKVTRFERGVYNPAPDDLISFAQYFGVSINWLLALPHELDGAMPNELRDIDWAKVVERATGMGLTPEDVMMMIELEEG